MALVLADRVKETSSFTGTTSPITLLGAATGFQSFAAVGNSNTTFYAITNPGTNEWEVGIGTYASSGTTLARTTILASSNSGLIVTFSAGTKEVFVTYPAGKSVNQDASGIVVIPSALRLSGSTSGYVGLAPAAIAGSTTYVLPNADGTVGQVLSTNGSGTLSWATAGGGGGVTKAAAIAYTITLGF
jgi:hypothetical protein